LERMPRVRFGQVHLSTTSTTRAETTTAIGLGVGASIRTEKNAFLGVKTPLNLTGFSDSASASRPTGTLQQHQGDAPKDVSGWLRLPAALRLLVTAASQLEADVKAGAGPK